MGSLMSISPLHTQSWMLRGMDGQPGCSTMSISHPGVLSSSHFTLWETNSLRTGKSQSPIGTSTISKRAMFNSYVKLPEGIFEGREVRVRDPTSPNLHLPWNIQSCGQPGGFREDSMTVSSLKN